MLYYVDVSKYQPENLKNYKNAGAKGAIVQLSVAQNIKAPKAGAQIHSAKVNSLHRLFYHYATFGHNVKNAVKEAEFAIHEAKRLGFSSIHIFCDWEGQDNDTSGSKSANTAAILAFMRAIHKAGFTAGLYSSASLLYTKINTHTIIKEFGSCLWVASYPKSGAVNTANMSYFPSMDGVCIWQFTDNWHGLSVDGNVVVYDPFKLKKVQKTGPYKPKKTVKKTLKKSEKITITGDNLKITKE